MKTITATALLLACALLGAEEDAQPIMDRIILKDGTRKTVQVVSEGLAEVVYRNVASNSNKTMHWSIIKEIRYDGMDAGYYHAAIGLRNEANYEAAAEHFMTLVTNAKREWEGVYGYYNAGICLEKAGRYESAAAKFATFCTTYPKNPRWIDAKYYEGINLARLEKVEEAEEAIKLLKAYQEVRENRLVVGRRPEIRGNAIKAVILALDPKTMMDAEQLAKRVRFGRGEEEISYHWDNFWAYFLLEKEKYEIAGRAFKALLKKAAGNPMREAECSVGYGMALAEAGDLNGALMQFLKLDILPYGTAKQRCRAQYWAGKILWELAKENAAKDDKPAKDLAETQKEQSRLLLGSCIANPTSLPERDKAVILLEKYFPPEEPKEAKEGEEAKAKKAP